MIDEKMAKVAKEINSFSSYREGSATEEFNYYVGEAREILNRKKEEFPEDAEFLETLFMRYCTKLERWMNEGFRIEAMCPSIMVSGGSNFPTRKKEKQNSRRESHMKAYEEVQRALHRLQRYGTGGIKSSDARALEKLQTKLEILQEQHETMKDANKFFRSTGSLEGFQMDDSLRKTAEWNVGTFHGKPFPAWSLQNNLARIHATEDRIKQIEKAKEAGTTESETEIEGLKVVENAEAMRIQLIFDEKPDDATRTKLKGWGFKWSPKSGAWQRMLNENGKHAVKMVLKELQTA